MYPSRYSIGIFPYGIRKKLNQKMANRSKPKPDFVAIGSRMRSLRGRIRQDEFAALLNVSQGQLSKVERGKSAPTLEMLVAVAGKFDKTLDWIVLGSE